MNGTYYTITEVFDFGPHISKVILDYGKSMKGAAPSPEQFTVHVTRTSTEGEDFVWPNFMGDKPDDSMDGTRRVSNVYVSDKSGAPCEDGTCLTLELPCFIMEGIGSIIKFNGNFNVFVTFIRSFRNRCLFKGNRPSLPWHVFPVVFRTL